MFCMDFHHQINLKCVQLFALHGPNSLPHPRLIEVIFKPSTFQTKQHHRPPWTLDDVLKELHGRHYIFILCGA